MHRHLLSLLAGAVLPFAFAPFGQFWIAPLSYAALFYLWRGARPVAAFWTGLLYGLASFGFGTYWTYIAIHVIGEVPIALALIVSCALVLTLALFVAVAGVIAARWFKTDGVWAWFGTLPALWVLAEWLRGWAFTGFGWLAAGYSQSDSWLMGYAPLLGVHGISFAVTLASGALLALVFGTKWVRSAAAGTLVAVAGVGFAAANHDWTRPKERMLTVALVQGAVKQDLKWRPEQLPATLELYSGLSERVAGSDLIVWPEAAIPDLYERVTAYLAALRAWSKQHGSTVLLGVLRADPSGGSATFQNVLVALTDTPLVYVKRHLVPYGEYYPVPKFMRSWLQMMNVPDSDAVPGAADQPPLEVAGESIAATICYEDVFGAEQLHYLPDATLLVNVSNDAWFGDSIAPHQHLQIARVRAAEVGRYLLRATNTGITAFVDPHGLVIARAPQFEPAVLTATVRGYTGATPYARWGNYPVIVAALLVLAIQWATRFTASRRPR